MLHGHLSHILGVYGPCDRRDRGVPDDIIRVGDFLARRHLPAESLSILDQRDRARLTRIGPDARRITSDP
jgi:hypothetical protein